MVKPMTTTAPRTNLRPSLCAMREPARDELLRREQQRRAEDEEGDEVREGLRARAQQQDRAERAADERRNRQQQQPSSDVRQLTAKAEHSGERPRPHGEAVRGVG